MSLPFHHCGHWSCVWCLLLVNKQQQNEILCLCFCRTTNFCILQLIYMFKENWQVLPKYLKRQTVQTFIYSRHFHESWPQWILVNIRSYIFKKPLPFIYKSLISLYFLKVILLYIFLLLAYPYKRNFLSSFLILYSFSIGIFTFAIEL